MIHGNPRMRYFPWEPAVTKGIPTGTRGNAPVVKEKFLREPAMTHGKTRLIIDFSRGSTVNESPPMETRGDPQ